MKGKILHSLIVFTLALIILAVYKCSEPEVDSEYLNATEFLNLNDTVKYLGIEACTECHYDKYLSYMRSGMGLSWDSAFRSKSASVIGPDSILYDMYKDLHFKPLWEDDALKITEFRLSGQDTVHNRTELVNYIVGSGQHTNSHIYVVNGYAHQVPFTFYTQDQKFDLPPGFEVGHNTRFNRKIGLECMSCHNSLPDMVLGSENKYTYIPTGINCERCHGPGEIHVYLKKQGVVVDTSQFTDYSIVNPANLSPERQMDICVRCHLQGTMVLKPGKSFYDFKPGMDLSKVMDIFMPRFKGGKEDFIMASHVERLKESKCYIASGNELNCRYCHGPHVTHREVDQNIYIKHCTSCHNEQSTSCNASEELRKQENDHCIVCHMEESYTRDIPHVTIHDHKIAIPPTPEELASERKFLGLISVNNPGTDSLSVAKGYLLEHESYHADEMYLDSAYHYLQWAGWLNKGENLNAIINYYFLKEDHEAIIDIVENTGTDKMLTEILVNVEYSNIDAWTAYRIGQAYELTGNIIFANKYYQRATSLAKYNLEFQNKLGSTQVMLQQVDEAKATFEFILAENPLFSSAHVNYGYTLLLQGLTGQAEYHYDIALKLDPDQVQALLNKAGLCFLKNDLEQGKYYIDRVLLLEPDNEQAKMIKQQLN